MARNKKGPLLIGTSVAICVLFAFCVFAHPGRTDKNGGHWDREAGTYHFHTGEHAGKGSGGSSTPTTYVPFTPPYEPPTENPYRQGDTKDRGAKKSGGFWYVVACGFVLMYVAGLVWGLCRVVYDVFLSGVVSWLLKRILPNYKINAFREKIKDLQFCMNEISEVGEEIANLAANACGVSLLYEIGEDGLPRDRFCSSQWGDSFTLYRTHRGVKLHAKYMCCSATNPEHAYWHRNRTDFRSSLCKICAINYRVPDVPEYEYRLRCKKAKTRREVLEHKRVKLQAEADCLYQKCASAKIKILITFSENNKNALREAIKEYKEIKKLEAAE